MEPEDKLFYRWNPFVCQSIISEIKRQGGGHRLLCLLPILPQRIWENGSVGELILDPQHTHTHTHTHMPGTLIGIFNPCPGGGVEVGGGDWVGGGGVGHQKGWGHSRKESQELFPLNSFLKGPCSLCPSEHSHKEWPETLKRPFVTPHLEHRGRTIGGLAQE